MKKSYKNLFKSLTGTIIIATIPLVATRNIQLFLVNFIIIFIGMLMSCFIVDLFYKFIQLKKEEKEKMGEQETIETPEETSEDVEDSEDED